MTSITRILSYRGCMEEIELRQAPRLEEVGSGGVFRPAGELGAVFSGIWGSSSEEDESFFFSNRRPAYFFFV